ncbi:MAG: O-antigen ligase family protein, partial [Gaiella sp.]
GWFGEQLDLVYRCLSGLPENWILNTGDEQAPLRRLVSTFLSPLASAYLLVVALLLLTAARPRPWTVGAGVVVYAGLLWTHTRAAFIALAVGLVVLAALRRWVPAALAAGSIAASALFVAVFPSIGPTTSYTATELACLRANAAATGGDTDEQPLVGDDASTRSHLRNLRDGLETVLDHPQGHGLGNAGVVASRTGVEIKAGESTYLELGVDTGVAGLAAFVAWLAALLLALRRRSQWLASSLAAVAVIGLQTDVIGVHWIAVVVFALSGAALRAPPGSPSPEEAL